VLGDRLFVLFCGILVQVLRTHELLDESGLLRILQQVFNFFRLDLPFDEA
jgi:hypothetical protein